MGSFENLTETEADRSVRVATVTVANEDFVNLFDTVGDGGCVSGVVDANGGCENMSVELRKGSTASEYPANCLSGNSCRSYGCGETMDQPNGYQPPFGTYLVDGGIDFTNSENFREVDRTDGVNGVSFGPEGQIEKKEFGVSGLCSTESDIENQLINDNGLENPSPDGESLSTSPGCSGITYILPNEQKETGLTGSSSLTYITDCLDDPYLDSSQGDDEEKVHGSSGISSDLPTGENIDGLTKGSPEIASYNLAEGLVTPLSLLFGVADISCSKYLSVSDSHERCGVNALTCCSSSKGGSSGLTSNDGWNNFECNTMFEANNVDVVPSSSSMAARVSKSNRLTRTRRAARQCRQTVPSSSGLGNTLGATLNKIRGKRSNFCKPARLNIWGELGSLVQIFDQNASMPEFTIRNSCHEVGLLGRESKVVKSRGSVKRSGVRRRRCQKTEVGGTFKGLDHSTSTNRQRSKVKMEGHRGRKGKQSLFPEVDSLDGVGLKPSDVQSLFSVVKNPNLVAVGSNSNLEVKCIHTGIKSWVCEPDCQQNLEVPEPVRELAHKLEADGCGSEHLDQLVVFKPAEEFKSSLDGNSGRPIMSRNVSVLDSQHGDKDTESTVTVDVLTEYTSGDCQGVSPPVEIEVSKEAIVNKHLELGLFPALEGFNLIPEKAAIMSEVTVSTGQKSRAKKGKKNEKVKGDLYISAGSFPVEQKMLDPVNLNKASKLVKSRTVKNVRNKNGPKAAFNSAGSTSDSGKSPGLGGFSVKTSPSDITEVKVTREIVKAETGMEAALLSGQCPFGITQSAAPVLEGLLPISKRKGKGPTLPKKSTVAARKSRSHVSDSTKSRKGNARGKKENTHNTLRGSKMEEKGVLHESCCKDRTHTQNISSCFETGMCSELRKFTELSENNLVAKDAQQEIGGLNGGKEVASRDMAGSVMVTVGDDLAPSKSSEGSKIQCFPPRVAWVLCDDCQKWRCIPAELADIIEETDSKWTCKDNTDLAFADCSIPQEKSNAEINAELNISDEDSCSVQPCFKGSEFKQLTASQQASWTLIKSNLFLHRSRRTQTIDEIMVCQCKPPLDGSMGCGDECLNRILNIECVQGTCPCGDLCSNQQFQRQKYANFKWFRCGKKGYGLQLQEDISQGAFLIEYVGEVLDLHAYEARQQDYASKGQRHFYFMTLNGSEVIDACAKGNLGRFINHSCDPNCRTEKWMVNGEVCIGLFALRNIKKGEEVTFDYNYVRVFGAAAKKCVCGSPECRGYIGGDPSNTEVVQVDSDDDYPESIMIHEDGRMERFVEDKILDSSLLDPVAVPQGDHLEETKILDSRLPDVGLSQEEHLEEEAIPDTSLPDAVTIPQEEHFRVERIPNTRLSDIFPVPSGEISLQTTQIKSQPSSDSVEDNLKISKQCSSRTKSPCIASSIKKGRCINSKIKSTKPKKLIAGSESSRSSDRVDAKLNEIKSIKPKKMVAGAESSRIEGVEEKLNEVLDAEGGISKRKDATKGYLKLLLVTAASGDNIKGEAFQSTRDLSIVLDALLKTKSRMVLVDIVNKNGLQMLHNMIKQNRRNFNKTPIIRKLLKVLEFLAVKEILTMEQINAGPPCAGMESFRDSIFILARHSDTQVQRIARSFRDKWMPRTFRKVNNLDREDAEFSHGRGHWKEFSAVSQKHRQGLSACHDAINCTTQKIPNTTMLDNDNLTSLTSPSPMLLGNAATSTTDRDPTTVSKQRKRKSRWDQPTEMATGAGTQPQQNTKRLIIEANSNLQHCSPSQVEPSLRVPEVSEMSQNQIMDCSDRQPYFPNPTCSEVVMGQPQVKFLSNLPVSYGIPLPLVQQLGTYHQEEAGGDGCSCSGWEIAPAVPFHPFPPLPPFPPPLQPSANNHTMLLSQRKYREEAQADNCSRNHHMESTTPTVSGTTPSEAVALNRTRSPRSHERGKWSSGSLGRRYFRHQKWNSQGYLKTRPWVRQHSSCASKGNWKHGGFSCVENVTNEMGSMGRADHLDRRTTGGPGLCPLEELGGRNASDKYYHQNPPSHH